MTNRIRRLPRLSPMLVALGVCYFVIIGGTAIGEVHPVVRAINGVAAGGLIAAYLVRAPREADWFDRRMLVALLLFAGAAMLSQFPRQSFDSLLSALAMVAAIFVLRGLLTNQATRHMLVITLRSLSLGLTVMITALWSGVVGSWFAIVGEVVPPIGVTYPPGTWGHPYDVALLLLLLVPSWFVAPRSRVTVMIGCSLCVIDGVIAVLSGSRSVWLAALLATTAVFVLPYLLDPAKRKRTAILLGISLIGMVAVVLSPIGEPLLERVVYTSTIGLRAELWTTVGEAWLQRPLSGLGPGSFPWLLQTTQWFDANTAAPIHPDNIVVHALGEGGLLGLAALGMLISVAPRAWTASASPVRWVLAAFAVATVGTNPSAFSFFIAVIGVWIAYALPRPAAAATSSHSAWRSRGALRASTVLAGFVAVAFLSVSSAHIAHAFARSNAEAARYEQAEAQFAIAAALDPGMSLYWRDLAIARWLRGDDDDALDGLARAKHINPWDDLTWRVEGVIRLARGDGAGAIAAMTVAIGLQRSDVANLLLGIRAHTVDGRHEMARDMLAEVVQGWPTITGASTWPDLRGSTGGPELLERALQRWDAGSPTPVKKGYQEVWLRALTGGQTNAAGTPSRAVAEAMVAAIRCDSSTEALLAAVGGQDLLWPEYWETKVRAAANAGTTDPDAKTGYTLTSHVAVQQQDPRGLLNPINEGQWAGYRRVPTFWPNAMPMPSPEAGRMRWALLPDEAMAAAGVEGVFEQCRIDQ